VVVCAPYVDDAVVAAFQLVHVVGDVRGEIGALAVLPHNHPVFLVTEVGGAEPLGTALLIHVAGQREALDGALHRAVVGQGAFRKPLVVAHAELPQVTTNVLQYGFQPQVEDFPVAVWAEQFPAAIDQRIDMQFLVAAVRFIGWYALEQLLCRMVQCFAVRAVQAGADVPDVIAPVAVARKRNLFAAQLQVAQVDTGGEDIHLPPGVINVVFAVYPVAHGLKQIGYRGTVRCTAAVADVQRTGRIGGDEFDLHQFALAEVAAPVALALLQDLGDVFMIGRRAQEEIDEAWAGDFDAGDSIGGRQVCHQRFRQLARFAVRELAQHHGQVAGKVAVTAIAGPLQVDVDGLIRRQYTPRLQGFNRSVQELRKMLFHGGPAGCKAPYYPGCLRGFNRFDGKRCAGGQPQRTGTVGAAIIA